MIKFLDGLVRSENKISVQISTIEVFNPVECFYSLRTDFNIQSLLGLALPCTNFRTSW